MENLILLVFSYLKNQECSIPDTTGYIIDIKDQSINNFDNMAQCNKSMGYEGSFQVHPCSEHSEFITGCGNDQLWFSRHNRIRLKFLISRI